MLGRFSLRGPPSAALDQRRRHVVLGALFVAALGLSGCDGWSSDRAHFRLTVVVDGPHGSVTASGVYELSFTEMPAFPNPGSTTQTELRGDALPIRLPSGQIVYVLLARYYGEFGDPNHLGTWGPGYYLSKHYGNVGRKDESQLAQGESGPPIEVPVIEMPALAYFSDPSRPETGKLVDPRDLSAICGPGCAVRHVYVRLTNAPVTRGIADVLPLVRDIQPTDNQMSRPDIFSKNRQYFTR